MSGLDRVWWVISLLVPEYPISISRSPPITFCPDAASTIHHCTATNPASVLSHSSNSLFNADIHKQGPMYGHDVVHTTANHQLSKAECQTFPSLHKRTQSDFAQHFWCELAFSTPSGFHKLSTNHLRATVQIQG